MLNTADTAWNTREAAEAAEPGILDAARKRLGKRVQSTRYYSYEVEVEEGEVSIGLMPGTSMTPDQANTFAAHVQAAAVAAHDGNGYFVRVLLA